MTVSTVLIYSRLQPTRYAHRKVDQAMSELDSRHWTAYLDTSAGHRSVYSHLSTLKKLWMPTRGTSHAGHIQVEDKVAESIPRCVKSHYFEIDLGRVPVVLQPAWYAHATEMYVVVEPNKPMPKITVARDGIHVTPIKQSGVQQVWIHMFDKWHGLEGSGWTRVYFPDVQAPGDKWQCEHHDLS